MSDYFDLTRITELQSVLGSEAGTIVATMLGSMSSAVERIEAAVATGELEQASRAAHAARNDALMLGARQLLDALTELETASRDGHEERAQAALARVQAVWPPTRNGLAAVAASR